MPDITDTHEPDPIVGHEPVGKHILDFLERRIEFGIKKYGLPVSTWNGRDPTVDNLQEQSDGFQYAMQAHLERKDMMDLLTQALPYVIERDVSLAHRISQILELEKRS